MEVWTIQPAEALNEIEKYGSYRCDPARSFNLSKSDSLEPAYKWLMGKMREKIGDEPEGVEYPIWAWHTWNFERKAPDPEDPSFLKRETEKVLMTLDIPDDRLVLTDFDAWHGVMMNAYVSAAVTEEEYNAAEEKLENLPEDELADEIARSWDNVFLTDRVETDYLERGRYIQATFWEILPEYVKNVETLPPNAVEEV